jgi:hypothetical protein
MLAFGSFCVSIKSCADSSVGGAPRVMILEVGGSRPSPRAGFCWPVFPSSPPSIEARNKPAFLAPSIVQNVPPLLAEGRGQYRVEGAPCADSSIGRAAGPSGPEGWAARNPLRAPCAGILVTEGRSPEGTWVSCWPIRGGPVVAEPPAEMGVRPRARSTTGAYWKAAKGKIHVEFRIAACGRPQVRWFEPIPRGPI